VQAQQPQRPRSPTATIVPIAPAPGGIDVQAGRLAPDVTNEPTAAAADPRPGSERDGGAQESALGDRRKPYASTSERHRSITSSADPDHQPTG
jgi:hypothetical protein